MSSYSLNSVFDTRFEGLMSLTQVRSDKYSSTCQRHLKLQNSDSTIKLMSGELSKPPNHQPCQKSSNKEKNRKFYFQQTENPFGNLRRLESVYMCDLKRWCGKIYFLFAMFSFEILYYNCSYMYILLVWLLNSSKRNLM